MFTVVYVSNGYIFYALTYLELFPDYICAKSVPKDQCNHELMCSTGGEQPNVIRVDWTSHHSLYNWVDRLNLACEPGWKIGFIGSMYLMGWSAGCLFIPRLGDVYGRRKPFLICSALSVLVYLGLLLSKNIDLTMALYLLLGLSTPGKVNIGYVYLLELVPTAWQTYVGTVLLIGDGSTMIFLSLYLRYISKDWFWF
jgi:MFS family permease